MKKIVSLVLMVVFMNNICIHNVYAANEMVWTVANYMSSVCWSPENQLFVAVGCNTSYYGMFYTSIDGIDWTLRKTNTSVSRMTSVCWSPEKELFVAVGYNASNYGIYYTSPDGITWTLRQTNTSDSRMNSVCWSPEKQLFVAVGVVGSGTSIYGMFYTSPDGITWTLKQTNTVASTMVSVCWSPEKQLFVAVGSGTSNYGITSLDDENYSVVYHSNSGSLNAPIDNNTYTTSSSVVIKEAITKPGSTFKGWSKNQNGTGSIYQPDQVVLIGEMVTQ